jgi:hypothetical protein
MISGTDKLTSDLAILRQLTGKSNQQILSEIITPLTEIVGNFENGNYYIAPTPDGLGIEIKCYSLKNQAYVISGKATQPLGQILGTD